MISDAHLRPAPWTNRLLSPLCLGMSRVGSFASSQGLDQARHILGTALDLGVNIFDTADIYGQGQSERVLGEVLRGRREDAVLCTKVGYRPSMQAELASRLKPLLKPLVASVVRRSPGARQQLATVRASQMTQDFSPAHIDAAVAASLRRLRTDFVDLLLLHSPPPDLAADEVVPALQRLIKQGRIRAFGVACRDPADALGFMAWPDLSAVQLRMPTPVELKKIAAEARRNNVGLIVREALAQLPPQADERARESALRAPLATEEVQTVVVGTQNPVHLIQNIEAVCRPV